MVGLGLHLRVCLCALVKRRWSTNYCHFHRWQQQLQHPCEPAGCWQLKCSASEPRQHQQYSVGLPSYSVCENQGSEIPSLCAHGQLDRAVDVLCRTNTALSDAAYLSLLKACTERKALHHAKRICLHLTQHGPELTRLLGNSLVITLAKCGNLEGARSIFNSLPSRTLPCWKAIISGYTEWGRGQESLRLYQCMQEDRVEPDEYTLVCLLKACGSIPNLEEGRKFHGDTCRKGYDGNTYITSSLLNMYGMCGSIVEAEKIFKDSSSSCDIVSWNVMISLYAEQGHVEKALQCYRQTQVEGKSTNVRTLVTALQACGILAEKEEANTGWQFGKGEALKLGQQIHTDGCRRGYALQVFVASTLVSMYSKCGSLIEAENVFNQLIERDTVSWNVMLCGYMEHQEGTKVLQLYRQMLGEWISPDERTIVFALQACGALAEKEEAVVGEKRATKKMLLKVGQAVHAVARRMGFASHAFVGSALVSMYGKCGNLVEAENVFSGLSKCDVVSWSVLLWVYVEQGLGQEPLRLYKQMQEEGVHPDDQAFVTAIKACCYLAETGVTSDAEELGAKAIALKIGKALDDDAQSKGFSSDFFVVSTLVTMYGKSGDIVEAENAFTRLSPPNVVLWNAMLSVYAEQGHHDKTLVLYRQMQNDGIPLDDVTLVSVLQACIETENKDMCKQLHFTMVAAGYNLSSLLSASLIHAYGSRASMSDAQAVFDELSQPDVVSWNVCMFGHSREGNCMACVNMFEEMQGAGVKPDGVSLLSLLWTFSHAGLVDKGMEYFASMSMAYGETPEVKHFTCMLDLLGRAGDFDRVENMFCAMPMQAEVETLLCLLSACCTHGNLQLGKNAFDHTVNLQPKEIAAYVLMSKLYADARLLEYARDLNCYIV